jgi:hypothetical protein
MPERPFNEMSTEERREMMARNRGDRDTTAAPERILVDLREYLHAVAAVCDSLVGPADLANISVTCTERGAILIAILVPRSDTYPFELYSGAPKLNTDILSLFTNLADWINDSQEPTTVRPACPLNGHRDEWDLQLLDAAGNPADDGELWRVCRTTGQCLGRFRW